MSLTYGEYGGRYVPETLIPALDELTAGWEDALADDAFRAELHELATSYAGRPTPLTLAERFAPDRRIWLKREDLMHTGAHKLNNALGQAVLARRLGKGRIVAETGAGQHGVAAATVCARFGFDCVVYMGSEDMRRQAPNVERMKLLGAEVHAVEFGTKTLKEATSEAIRDWITNVETTHYLIGSCVGPAPYPAIVRELQAVIGREAREQILAAEGRLPEAAIACVGGGSNAIGLFAGFLEDEDVRLLGVEAAGAASLGTGRTGILHGSRSSLLADEDGQIVDAHSISAGLDYPGVGPEHAALRDSGRADYLDVHRRRGPRRVPAALSHRGDHPRARVVARARTGARPQRRADPRLPLRPRRQGSRGGARAVSRADQANAQLSTYTFPDEVRVDELLLRAPRQEDIDAVAPAFRDPDVGGEAGLPPVDADTLRMMLREQLPMLKERGLLAPYLVDDGAVLGGISLHHFDPMRDVVEVGYWLFPQARGRGVATRSVRALLDHAFANGIWRAEAHVRVGNTASERVLERLGFRHEGIKRGLLRHQGERVDANLFGLLADDA